MEAANRHTDSVQTCSAAGAATDETDLTVVVVTYRGRNLLPACLDSLAGQTLPHRLLVVDNGSTDGTSDYLSQRLSNVPTDGPASVRVLRLDDNAGFAGGVATALQVVHTQFVALLNDDAQAAPDWLEQLYSRARHEHETAAWTSLMLRADRPGVVQNAGAALLATGYGTDLAADQPADAIGDAEVFGFCGGAALLRTAAVRAVGGFPAEFFLYYEDLDTSWRLRLAGWRIARVAAATVRHLHSATSDQTSELFHFHNERNRLLTLLRCAPAHIAILALLRFTLTTASVAVKSPWRRTERPAPNLQPALRLRVLGAVMEAVPSHLRSRASIGRRSGISRGTVWRRWSGLGEFGGHSASSPPRRS